MNFLTLCLYFKAFYIAIAAHLSRDTVLLEDYNEMKGDAALRLVSAFEEESATKETVVRLHCTAQQCLEYVMHGVSISEWTQIFTKYFYTLPASEQELFHPFSSCANLEINMRIFAQERYAKYLLWRYKQESSNRLIHDLMTKFNSSFIGHVNRELKLHGINEEISINERSSHLNGNGLFTISVPADLLVDVYPIIQGCLKAAKQDVFGEDISLYLDCSIIDIWNSNGEISVDGLSIPISGFVGGTF